MTSCKHRLALDDGEIVCLTAAGVELGHVSWPFLAAAGTA
jgi:hypothetical protein